MWEIIQLPMTLTSYAILNYVDWCQSEIHGTCQAVFFCRYADADVLILIVIYNNCFASSMFRIGRQEVKSSHQTFIECC